MTRSAQVIALQSLLASVLMTVWVSASARADRPTSDTLSLISGRTVGNGEVILGGGLGWPGFFAEVLLSPTSTFDFSIRAHVDYGAQIGTGTGVGGGLSLPMRLHIYGEGHTDIAVTARPFFAIGEGALVGELGTFADDLGWALGLEAGLRVGFQVAETTTLVVGASGFVAFNRVADADENSATGGGAPVLGVEAAFSRSTVVFAEALLGYAGAAPERFDGRLWLRVALGLGYRL